MKLEQVIDGMKNEDIFEIEDKKRFSLTRPLDEFLWELNDDVSYDHEAYGGEIYQGFHPSQLKKEKCLRRLVLTYHDAPKVEGEGDIDPTLRRIFDNGSGVHDRIQKYLQILSRKKNAPIILLGKWTCRCGYKTDSKVPIREPKICPTCKRKTKFWYGEWRVRDDKLRIVGKIDGILKIRGKKELYLLEIKSINSFGYQKLKGIDPLNRIQINLYLMLTKLKTAIVLYESKNDQRWQDFVVKYDKKSLSHVLDNLKEVKGYMDKGVLPPVIEDTVLCKRCIFRKSCKKFKVPQEGGKNGRKKV